MKIDESDNRSFPLSQSHIIKLILPLSLYLSGNFFKVELKFSVSERK